MKIVFDRLAGINISKVFLKTPYADAAMDLNSTIRRIIKILRCCQSLSFSMRQMRLLCQMKGKTLEVDNQELIDSIGGDDDILSLTIKLSIMKIPDFIKVVPFLQSVSSDNNQQLITLRKPDDLTTIFTLLREEISSLADMYKQEPPYEYLSQESFVEGSSSSSYSKAFRGCCTPLIAHSPILELLSTFVVNSDPCSVIFPGDKKGYVQMSSVSLNCTTGYTFTAWIKLSSSKQETKGFVLFRTRSPTGGIDVILSDKNQDGQYQVVIRSFREMTPGTSTIFKEEIQGIAYITPNKWHLVAVKHSKFYIKSAVVSFLVDGVLEWENELSYPFTTPTDSQWIIGLGFYGHIGSFAVYSDCIDSQLLKLQYDQGYNCKTVHSGIRFPQSSFDTGYTTLGSLVVKGSLALKLVKCTLLFAIDSSHFLATGDLGPDSTNVSADYDIEDYNKGLPPLKGSFMNVDKIEMMTLADSSMYPMIPILSGECKLNVEESIVDYFLSHSGTNVLLYLLHGYCSLLSKPIVIDSRNTYLSLTENEICFHLISCVKSVLKLLKNVLSVSGEIREQFLQNHGFHLVSTSLSKINLKVTLIDEDIVLFCMSIIESYGLDSKRGDAVCSSLQGLFFDFRLWSNCNITIKTSVLNNIATITKNGGDLLFKYIGVQRTIDFLRLHVLSNSLSALDPMESGQSITNRSFTLSSELSCMNPQDHQKLVELYDAGYRLLVIVIESAKIYYQKIKSFGGFNTVIEILLNALDESLNDRLSESILRILFQLHAYSPQGLAKCLNDIRYNDTTIVSLLTKSCYSIETRKLALQLLFWCMTEDNKSIPVQLLSIRKNLVLNKVHEDISMSDILNPTTSKPKTENKKTLELSIQYTEAALPLKRAWDTLTMLSHHIDESIQAGHWNTNSVPESSERNKISQKPDGVASNSFSSSIDHMLDFLSFESASGTGISPWLVLPMLPCLLSRSSLLTCQRILMSLNVSLKTDDSQVEVVCSFPDRQWMTHVLSLAVLSEKLAPVIATEGFEIIYQEQCQRDDNRIASTCIELALDTLATIMERKMRYSGMNARLTWNHLHTCLAVESSNLHLEPITKSSVDKRYLKRCLALVLQRIAKGTEPWSIGLLESLTIMFTLVYSKQLCGNKIVKPSDTYRHVLDTSNHESYEDLLTFDGEGTVPFTVNTGSKQQKQNTPHADEESQILCFLIDIMVSLRKTYASSGFNKKELTIMRLGLAIILGSLKTTNVNTADRLARDIMGQIKFFCDPSVIVFSEVFNDFIVLTFSSLKDMILDHSVPIPIRDRYCALVHAILHYFHELIVQPPSTKASNSNPGYVYRMKEALSHIDPNYDIKTILTEIESTLPLAGNSFSSLVDESLMDSQESFVAVSPTVSNDTIVSRNRQRTIDVFDGLSYDSGSLSYSAGDDVITEIIDHNAPTAITSSDHGSATREPQLNAAIWWKVRQGILVDRIDSERSRFTNDIRSYFIHFIATEKYSRKLRRRLEAEIFYDNHYCFWKLGISHESQFPSRRRVVLRPSYEIASNFRDSSSNSDLSPTDVVSKRKSQRISEKDIIDSAELSKSLAKAFSGVIKDVTSSKVDDVDDFVDTADGNNTVSSVPGQGWGLVDADGSDEGYGIVGVIGVTGEDGELDAQGPSQSNHDNQQEPSILSQASQKTSDDIMGDVRLIEASLADGRRIETGPCLSGTRRILHGPARYSARIILITASGNIWGTLSFNDKEIYFVSSLEPEDGHKDDSAAVNLSIQQRMRRRRWSVSTIGAIYLRRYRLRDTAIEVFFKRGKHRSFFVDFGYQKDSHKARDTFAKNLFNVAPNSAFKQWPSLPIHRLVASHQGLTEKWMNHEISNFEYLMMLNTIAGRSYHDLCQYPVMPWILSQYTQSSIDLNDSENYRDLSKPMGALNSVRLQEFLSRYESFQENSSESEIPAFMYGSHYSTMVGVVLHYLIRVEPFASLHKEMQGGHFDVSDRLFSSIPRTWRHNTNQLSEVKELTPEWFTHPEIFRNINHFNLGKTQDGEEVSDVALPPWASTPEEFVKINALAMESNYVSEHIHEWIDLIFGYKQQGPDSVEANNVFYYLTYYGTVNRDLIEDEGLRKAIELQIAHFGQMPYQIFRQPHPQRLPLHLTKSIIPRPIVKCFIRPSIYPVKPIPPDQHIQSRFFVLASNFEEKLMIHCLPTVLVKNGMNLNKLVILCTLISNDRITVIYNNGVVEVYKYNSTEYVKQKIANYQARMKAKNTVQQTQKSKPPAKQTIQDEPASGPASEESNVANISSHSSHMISSSPEESSLVALISLDDDLNVITGDTSTHASTVISSTTGNNVQSIDQTNIPTPVSNSGNAPKEIEAPLIHLIKDTTHVDSIPRIVLAHHPNYLKTLNSLVGRTSSGLQCSCHPMIKYTVACKLLLSTGFFDGRISVFELDRNTGTIHACGDYLQHHCRVVSIATDAIPSSSTDVIASLDESGIILIWAVAKIRMYNANDDRGSSILFRHPQRLFRCWKSTYMSLDISCNIGIVVCLSHDRVTVYSIERDEILNSFSIINSSNFLSFYNLPLSMNKSIHDRSNIDLLDDRYTSYHDEVYEEIIDKNIVSKHIALSDDGYIVVNFRMKIMNNQSMDTMTVSSDSSNYHWIDYLVSYTISGSLCQVIKCPSEVTYFDCPRHGEVLAIGQENGNVMLLTMNDLSILYQLDVHKGAAPAIDPSTQEIPNATTSSTKELPTTSIDPPPKKIVSKPSPVVSVSLGPDPMKPAIMVISTLSGELYVRPLIDYLRWEKNRAPSVLSQIVTGHIQAVKGTFQTAQNFLSSTTESASAMAQNARQYADEAFGELKKINRATIWKGVGSLFGINKEKENKDG